MNNIELLFHEFLKENLSSGVCRQEDFILLNGCRQLYEATGEGVYQEFFMHKMDSAVDDDGNLAVQEAEPEERKLHNVGIGNHLLWMAEHSKEKKYKTAVEKQIALLKDECSRLPEREQPRGRWLYLTQPFYMEYETRYNNKAEYKQIVQWMTREGKMEIPVGTEAESKDVCWYLMALTDVLGCMSIEIYEHYRFLEEILKRTIRQYVSYGKRFPYEERADICGSLGYVILKACRQKNLNAEKYGIIGRQLLKNVMDSSNLEIREEVGVLMMAYAQLLSLNAETDFL